MRGDEKRGKDSFLYFHTKRKKNEKERENASEKENHPTARHKIESVVDITTDEASFTKIWRNLQMFERKRERKRKKERMKERKRG